MKGAQHYEEAERLLEEASHGNADDSHRHYDEDDWTGNTLRAAQAHATLALAAAQGFDRACPGEYGRLA